MFGNEVVVQRLLEAKAAVDAENKNGRGLGRGFGEENPLEEVDDMLMVQVLKILHFLWKVFCQSIWH